MHAKCILNIVELNWYQQFGDNKKILKICHHMLTLSSQLQNRSFHIICGKDEIGSKMYRNENCRCKARKTTVFHCQLCQFLVFLLLLSSQLLKLPTHFLSTSNFAIAMLVTHCW